MVDVPASAARRVLVTGGSGFIGTHLVTALLARGDVVRNVDIKRPNLPEHAPYWTDLDINLLPDLKAVVDEFQPEVIFNLAGIADLAFGEEAMLVNTLGLSNLLEATADLPNLPHLIHTSSQMIAKPGYKIKGPQDYDAYTVYGETKVKSEKILYAWQGAIPWTIIRPANIWGPWHPTMPTSTWKYLDRRWYMMVTGVDPLRSYGNVHTVVHQMISASLADRAKVAGKMFYGADAAMITSDWIDGFAKALTGKPVRRMPFAILSALSWLGEISSRVGGPSPINRGRLYRMRSEYTVDVQPTLDAFGPGPLTLQEGINETVDWLRTRFPDQFKS